MSTRDAAVVIPALRRLALLVLLAPAFGRSDARAQSVVGTLLQSDGVSAVPGAIVEARLGRNGVALRTLSTSEGRFRLDFEVAGIVSLRILRIGYRPFEFPSFEVRPGATSEVRVIVGSERVLLESVQVRAGRRCRVGATGGDAVALVWEEARKAMLLMRLTAAGSPLIAEWFTFDRTLDSSATVVAQQTVQRGRFATGHVFRSVTPQALATLGYIHADAEALSFFAPDVDVLLSDSFVRSHCFRLTTGPKGSVGLAFTPIVNADRRHDIEGTLWIDRASSELRRVDFRYTGFPELPVNAVAGGYVEFARSPSFGWLTTGWRAQVPLLAISTRDAGFTDLSRSTRNSRTVVREVRQSGGELERAIRGDTVVFMQERAAVAVRLSSSDPAVPVGLAMVSLQGTNVSGFTDSAGYLRLGPLPSGRYVASILVPALDALLARPIEVTVDASTGGQPQPIELPSARTALARLCGSDTLSAGSAILRGVVRDPSGTAVPRSRITVSFERVDARFVRTGAVRWVPTTVELTSDPRGRWQLCGVPRETDLVITAAADARTATLRTRVERARASVDVSLTLPD